MKRERKKGQLEARKRGFHRDKRVLLGGLAGGAAIAMGTSGYAVPLRGPGDPFFLEANDSRPLDVNGDDVNDLRFTMYGPMLWGEPYWEAAVDTAPHADTLILGSYPEGAFYFLARRFSAGERIGPGGTDSPLYYFTDAAYYVDFQGTLYDGGAFRDGQAGFVGFKFEISGEYHWGWAEIQVARPPAGKGKSVDMLLQVHGWGYESEPNVGIDAGAPEPGTLAALAIGAAAVVGGRRRKP